VTTTKKIRAVSTLYQRGKTQVPSEVRRSLEVKDGDKLVWIIEGEKWIVEHG
jgi:bifunctional DNA-binding transcriptional regulator/antitoxin component of YhaV-PrlF toxin-antitoxin module